MIIIPGIYNAQTHIPGGNVQGQVITVGAILKVTERDRRPYPSDPGTPSEIWIDNTAAIGYVCKEVGPNGTVWDRLDVLGDYVAFGDNDPGVNADITWGYRPGSLRYARNSEILWICKDSTQGAAVWNVLSSGGSVVSVNGQTGVVQLYLDDLLDVDAPLPTNGDVLTWDSATSTWIALAPTGGGGTYTVNNGLSAQTTPFPDPNNFQLGGNIIQTTTLTSNSDFIIDRTSQGRALQVKNTSSGITNSKDALYAETTDGVAGDFFVNGNPSIYLNTDIQPIIKLRRFSQSGSANGIAGSIDFWLQNIPSTPFSLPGVPANRLVSKWENAVTNSRFSRFEIQGQTAGTTNTLLSLRANGEAILNQYGQTPANFPGIPVYALGVNATGDVIEFKPGVGGTYTVNNGLTENPLGNFQLGGQTLGTGNLIRDTYITNDGYEFRIDQTGSSTYALYLNHSGTGLNSGAGLRADAGGIAVRANSRESYAYEGISGLDYTAFLIRGNQVPPLSADSSVLGVLRLDRTTPGTPFGGIGCSIDFWIEPRTTILNPAPTTPTNRIASVWEDPGPTASSRLSRLDFYGHSNLSEVLNASINGNGAFRLVQYGQTPANFPGTPVWSLGVDALGNVVEFTPGGGGTYTVDNGLTPDPFNINNFQLGGNLIKSTLISAGLTTANNRLQIDAPQNTDTAGSLYVTALNPSGTYTSSNNILANFQSNDIITAFFRTGSSYGGSGTGVYIQSTNALCTPIVIYGSGALGSGEIFKVTDNGQLVLEEYNSSTSFQGVSGTSQGVLNVDNTGKVFVGSGGGGGGGGGGRSYYLNGSVVQGNFAGILDMREISPVPVIGTGTDFTINTNGYIKSFITDAGDPNKAVIPTGNWNFELWFSANNSGGSPNFYVELYKYDGAFTLIATGSGSPVNITNGTSITLYTTALSVPQTTLLLTDRLAVRVFVNNSGRTITLHTQGPHLSQIITDFPSGITSLNGLTAFTQNFATPGTTGTAPNWSSALDTHTLNIPLASTAGVTAGLISKTDYDNFTGKQSALTDTKSVKIVTGNVELDGDLTTPLANYVYGTNGSGTRGWKPDPTGGGNSIGELTGDVTAGPASSPSQSVASTLKTNLRTGSCGVTFDGQGGTISNGKTAYVQVPYAGTITGWTLVANVAGNCTVTVFKNTYINYPPTSPANNIFGTQPALLGVNKLNATGLSVAVTAGDYIGFTISGVLTVSWVNLTLTITKT